jgi:hypothetical protein
MREHYAMLGSRLSKIAASPVETSIVSETSVQLPVRVLVTRIEHEAIQFFAVKDDSAHGPILKTSFRREHNTDTFWIPEHTIRHQPVKQLQESKPRNINNLE